MENEKIIKANFKGVNTIYCFYTYLILEREFLNIQGVELAFYQLPGPVAAFAGIIVAFILFSGTIEEKFNTFFSRMWTSRYYYNVYNLSFSRSFCRSFKSYGWS